MVQILVILMLGGINLSFAEEPWFMLNLKLGKCESSVVDGKEISPNDFIRTYPKCTVESPAPKIYVVDCLKEPKLNSGFVFTRGFEACFVARDRMADSKKQKGNK